MSTDVLTTTTESLRDRMLEDMRIRGFVEKTRINYLRHLDALTEFLGRSPATATAEDLRRFQLSQTEAWRADSERRGLGAAVLLHDGAGPT